MKEKEQMKLCVIKLRERERVKRSDDEEGKRTKEEKTEKGKRT